MALKPTNAQISKAIIALDVDTDANWKKDGMPKIPVLQQALGVAVGSLQMGDVLEAMDIDPQAPVDMRSWRKDGWVGATSYENDPDNSQDDAPAETPAENGDGESTAEPTAGQKADKMIADARIEADNIIKKANEDADKIRSGAETEAAKTAQKSDTPAEPVILENRVLVKCVADSCGVNGNGENPDIDTLKRDDIAWITESIAEALGIDGSNQLMVIADPSDQVLERARNKKDLISA